MNDELMSIGELPDFNSYDFNFLFDLSFKILSSCMLNYFLNKVDTIRIYSI